MFSVFFADNRRFEGVLIKSRGSGVTRAGDDWPSLFVGARGTRSGVHVDPFESNFWMMMIKGRKRWLYVMHVAC